jgi:hypothetical protein
MGIAGAASDFALNVSKSQRVWRPTSPGKHTCGVDARFASSTLQGFLLSIVLVHSQRPFRFAQGRLLHFRVPKPAPASRRVPLVSHWCPIGAHWCPSRRRARRPPHHPLTLSPSHPTDVCTRPGRRRWLLCHRFMLPTLHSPSYILPALPKPVRLRLGRCLTLPQVPYPNFPSYL